MYFFFFINAKTIRIVIHNGYVAGNDEINHNHFGDDSFHADKFDVFGQGLILECVYLCTLQCSHMAE